MKKIFKWGAIIIVILIVIGVISGSSGNNSDNSNSSSSTAVTESEDNSDSGPNAPTSKQEEKTYVIGEAIPTDKLEITVSSVGEHDMVGGQYINEKASEGATLVVVDWKYKNVSEKPINAFSQPSIKLIDENGTEYNSDLGKSSTYAIEKDIDSKILSDLNPGITVNDAKVFEISKESFEKGEWKIQFKVSGKSYFISI